MEDKICPICKKKINNISFFEGPKSHSTVFVCKDCNYNELNGKRIYMIPHLDGTVGFLKEEN